MISAGLDEVPVKKNVIGKVNYMQLSLRIIQSKDPISKCLSQSCAKGDLCINQILAPLMESLVPVRLFRTLLSSTATSDGSGPDRPLKDLDEGSKSGRPCPRKG